MQTEQPSGSRAAQQDRPLHHTPDVPVDMGRQEYVKSQLLKMAQVEHKRKMKLFDLKEEVLTLKKKKLQKELGLPWSPPKATVRSRSEYSTTDNSPPSMSVADIPTVGILTTGRFPTRSAAAGIPIARSTATTHNSTIRSRTPLQSSAAVVRGRPAPYLTSRPDQDVYQPLLRVTQPGSTPVHMVPYHLARCSASDQSTGRGQFNSTCTDSLPLQHGDEIVDVTPADSGTSIWHPF